MKISVPFAVPVIQKHIVLLCVTVVLTFESGIMKSLGVLLSTLREQLVTQTWVIGLAISLIPGIGSLACEYNINQGTYTYSETSKRNSESFHSVKYVIRILILMMS